MLKKITQTLAHWFQRTPMSTQQEVAQQLAKVRTEMERLNEWDSVLKRIEKHCPELKRNDTSGLDAYKIIALKLEAYDLRIREYATNAQKNNGQSK